MAEKFAVSKSGHDKNHIYVIVREEEGYVYLADGICKTTQKPKKKSKKHIQEIKKLPDTVREVLDQKASIRDLEVKRAIKLYVKYQEEKECQKQM